MFPDSPPYVKYGQGDGTVNGISLQGCDQWKDSKWKCDHKYLSTGGEHLAILESLEFIKYVKDILDI